MVTEIRTWYNSHFDKEKYDAYVSELANRYPDALQFRIAETPLFVSKDFTNKNARSLRKYC